MPIKSKSLPAMGLLSLLAILIMAGPALACGTVDGWAATYLRGERHKALFHMLDCADSYRVPEDDVLLLRVVGDGLKREPKIAKMAASVFINFNCLYGARHEPDYKTVLKAVEKRGLKVDLNKFKTWLVVTARRGANLRAEPSLSGRILTAIKYKMTVRPVGPAQGDWLKVKAVGPTSVDPRFDRYTGYLHRSLVAPY